MKYSISGKIADKFQANPMTPLIAIMAVLLGLFAVLITPREEEPRIDVTFANVHQLLFKVKRYPFDALPVRI